MTKEWKDAWQVWVMIGLTEAILRHNLSQMTPFQRVFASSYMEQCRAAAARCALDELDKRKEKEVA